MLSILREEEERKRQAETRVAVRREHGKKEEDESRKRERRHDGTGGREEIRMTRKETRRGNEGTEKQRNGRCKMTREDVWIREERRHSVEDSRMSLEEK